MKKTILLITFGLIAGSLIQGQDNKLLLDSIVSYTIFLPDSSYYWKKCYEYDNLGQTLLEGEYRTYDNGRTWQSERLIQKVFDHEGNAIKVDTYRRAVPWTYVDEYLHYEKAYDGKGNLRIDSISIKNPETNEWFPWDRYEYSYNEKGLLTSKNSWHWSWRDQIWSNPGKRGYIYNSNDDLLFDYGYSWNGNNWIISTQPSRIYEYDEKGRLNKYYYSTIDYDVPVDMLIEYTYPTDNTRHKETLKKYRNDTAYWCFSLEKELYSIKGLLLSRICEGPYSEGGLMPNQKITWQYDYDGNAIYSTLYDKSGNDWRIKRRSTYYYNYLSTSSLKHNPSDIFIFPNPTSGIINFTGLTQAAEVRLYSIQGQLLKIEHQIENYIDISDLPAGVYFLNLKIGDAVVNKAIVKE